MILDFLAAILDLGKGCHPKMVARMVLPGQPVYHTRRGVILRIHTKLDIKSEDTRHSPDIRCQSYAISRTSSGAEKCKKFPFWRK